MEEQVKKVEYDNFGGNMLIQLIQTCDTEDKWNCLMDMMKTKLSCPYLLKKEEEEEEEEMIEFLDKWNEDVIVEFQKKKTTPPVVSNEKEKEKDGKTEENKETVKKENPERQEVVTVPKKSVGGVVFDDEGEKRLFEFCVGDRDKCQCMEGQRVRSKRPMDLFAFKVHYKKSQRHKDWYDKMMNEIRVKTPTQEPPPSQPQE
jgi:hypothetical protein